MPRSSSARTFLGSFFVDSGAILIGEPCDFRGGGGSQIPRLPPGKDGVPITRGQSDPLPAGLVVDAGNDGYCWVFAERDGEGQILRIVIQPGRVYRDREEQDEAIRGKRG